LSADAVYIGVHIRRSDMVYDPKYSVADVRYFQRAVYFMMRNFPNQLLVFVVCTDDLSWSKENIPDIVSREREHVTLGIHGNRTVGNHNIIDVIVNNKTANISKAIVVFSEGHGTEEDLAILSSCNHTIMTVGTYGWWAGYLAGGITVYYRKFPPKGSELKKWFSREDHFPPEWVGL